MNGRLRAPALRTTLDLYAYWQGQLGQTVDTAEMQATGLSGRPLTDRVFNAFPAFAAAALGGFYGALHVTMEDGNLEDDFVEDAVREATEEGGAGEIALARTLQAMTYAERVALYLSLSPFEETAFGGEYYR
jgi:hypothetical protein